MAVVCEHDVLIGKFLVGWDVVAEGLGREAGVLWRVPRSEGGIRRVREILSVERDRQG